MFIQTLCRVQTARGPARYKGAIVELGYVQGYRISQSAHWAYGGTLARRTSRACQRRSSRRTSASQVASRWQRCFQERFQEQEETRWGSTRIRNDRRDEGTASLQAGRHPKKGETCWGSTWGRRRCGGWQSASGFKFRNFGLRLCTYFSRRGGRDEDRNSYGAYSSTGAGTSRRISGEEEEEEGGGFGGYKRFHFEELERTADRPSGCHLRESTGAEAEEEKGEEVEQFEFGDPVRSDPYGEENTEGLERTQEEEEEETKGVEGWSDYELQQQLIQSVECGRAYHRQRSGSGGTYETEEQGSSGERAVNVDGACSRCHGTIGIDRPTTRSSASDWRGQGSELLCLACQALLQQLPEGVERDVYIGGHAGSSSRGRGPRWGFSCRQIYGTPSINAGSKLDDGSPHGAPQHGRTKLGKSIHRPGVSQALKVGGEGARERLVRLESVGKQRKRQRKRRLDGPWRQQGRERKRKEGKTQGVRKRPRLGEKSPGLGEVEGQGRREDMMSPPLEKSVTEREEGYYETISIGEALELCTSLSAMGCVLGWCLLNLDRCTSMQKNSSFVKACFSCGVWHKTRKRNLAFPIREGEFTAFREVSRSISLQDAAGEKHRAAWSGVAWTYMVCVACNFLQGAGGPLLPGNWCAAEKLLAKSIDISVRRFQSLGDPENIDLGGVKKELRAKRVNYAGEEMGVCTTLTFKQVVSALPPKEHGGVIDILPLVSKTTRDLLLHPERLVIEDVGQELPKMKGKIHVKPGELDCIADELVERGICNWIPLKRVFQFRGSYVLNGLFGVPKSSTLEDGSPVLRLIMNLVPGNSVTKQIRGQVLGLPHITSWLSTFVDEGEEIRLWQSDMSNAFYLFRIPEVWGPYLSFNVSRYLLSHDGLREEQHVLACRVLPMGWSSSVGVMQEVSQTILHLGHLPRGEQILRDRTIPLWMVGLVKESQSRGKAWWQVYLDNFAAGEISSDHNWTEGERLHVLAEEAWKVSNVMSSAKKRKKAEVRAQELGGHLDGGAQTLSASPERLLKLAQATIWLVTTQHMSKKLVQIIAGRWIYVFQFRRPAMALLESVWKFITQGGFDQRLALQTKRELWNCVLVLPTLIGYLGASITDVITASDASNRGGAVGIARTLTPAGEEFVRLTTSDDRPQEINVLVISLFNGIGGAFRCYDVLGLVPLHLVAFDTHGPAQRITSRRWPRAELCGDVRTLDESMILRWLTEYPEIEEIHLWGGFPCVDLSSVNSRGLGLDGKQSSLFFQVPRIRSLLKKEVPSHIVVRSAIENVASMPKTELEKISTQLGTRPCHLDCVQAVPMRRPRLCWCSERVGYNVEGVTIHPMEHWDEIRAEVEYPPLHSWLEEETEWPGYQAGFVLPTALKAIRRQRPPPDPAGLNRCNEDAIARWTSDKYRFPPYHYQERFLLWRDNRWRLANSAEKELLLGYGWGHTKLCFSASKIKQSASQYEDERLSLLGDSFSIYSFVIVGAALCRRYLKNISYFQLSQRMGMAPGTVLPWSFKSPLKRSLQYGTSNEGTEVSLRNLNQILLSRTNHTGSDVRISTGEILNPKSATRQSIEAGWWNWKPSFRITWKFRDRINLLELRSILLSVQFHVSHLKHVHARIFHISDSYVCMSVLSKGRSGSRQLNRLLKQINAYLLGHGLFLVIAHVESSENPTDGASRNLEVLSSPDKSRAKA